MPRPKIEECLAHRQEREAQVVAALRSGASSLKEIVEEAYADIPPVNGEHASLVRSSMTWSEYVTCWLEDSAKGDLAPRTYSNYKLQVRWHIVPAVGRVKLAKLNPAHVQALYAKKLREGLKPSSVRCIHAVLRRALEQVVR